MHCYLQYTIIFWSSTLFKFNPHSHFIKRKLFYIGRTDCCQMSISFTEIYIKWPYYIQLVVSVHIMNVQIVRRRKWAKAVSLCAIWEILSTCPSWSPKHKGRTHLHPSYMSRAKRTCSLRLAPLLVFANNGEEPFLVCMSSVFKHEDCTHLGFTSYQCKRYFLLH